MKFLDAVFGEKDDTAKQHPGKMAVCNNCDNREWIVFQLNTHNHFHLQCTMCGVSYCPFGACKKAT